MTTENNNNNNNSSNDGKSSSLLLLNNFDSFYQEFKRSLLEHLYKEKYLQSTIKRFENVIDYNVPHGKKLRGLCTYQSYLLLINDGNSNVDLENKAKALGWCIEVFQASFLVADDIMDNSKTRRGQLCWYLNKDVGNSAINDSIFLLSCVFVVLKVYLNDHKMYNKFYELFSETLMQTSVGQGLDLLTGFESQRQKDENCNKIDFSTFTKETYNAIVIWKTAYYSFYLPVACALFLANIDDKEIHLKVKDILIKMGHFFQVQDDYIDCYGDPKVTGKIGTDIEECKCGWLVVQALAKCNSEQKRILEENYGRNDEKCVKIVKNLYAELDLENDYKSYELAQYNSIASQIDSLNFNDNKHLNEIKLMLKTYVNKIFQRKA